MRLGWGEGMRLAGVGRGDEASCREEMHYETFVHTLLDSNIEGTSKMSLTLIPVTLHPMCM